MKISESEIEGIALGAAVLGAGGGGDPHIGKLMALDAVRKYGPVELEDPESVSDEALAVPIAGIGAPTVIVEKIPNGDEAITALRALESRLGKKASIITPIEQGGLNSQIPIAVAARLGLPLCDCDAMGRAFPETQMTSFHLAGINATPMVLADEKGNVVSLETIDNKWTERIARAVVVQMGGSALAASYSLNGRQLKRSCISGSVSLSLNLGRAIRSCRESGKSPSSEIMSILKGHLLFKGKIHDLLRRTIGGFSRGEIKLIGLEEFNDMTLEIRFQNENLVAIRDGKTVATVPDLISILDLESGIPITTESLRYGNRVIVIGSPCSEKLRTSDAIEVVGPRYFGYDIDYVPIEKLSE
ncbi:MAG: DUF917 domain-containing protein [Nitrososphaerota archaeon]|nr:DUF917 domain-containing protein [Nitrososphaerota archaeon]